MTGFAIISVYICVFIPKKEEKLWRSFYEREWQAKNDEEFYEEKYE